MHRFCATVLITLWLAGPASAAEMKYISDDIEVTLRSGTSTTNQIVKLLRSGDRVSLIEDDLATQYSLVETEDNIRGYVLSRFLMDAPPAREILADLQARFETQQQELARQRAEVERLNALLSQEQSDNETLKNTLRASEQELSTVREAASGTLDTLEQNQRLQNVVAQLQKEQTQLSEENLALRDSTRLDWFVRGGAVALVAFLVGILITRIRWRKNDSWGSY